MGIGQKIKGAFALTFLFGDGIKSFAGSKRDGLLSFLVPLALLPFGLLISAYYPPRGLHKGDFSTAEILLNVIAQGVLCVTLSVVLMVMIGKIFSQTDRLWLFFEANNWTAVPAFILTLPFAAAAVFGWVERDSMDRALQIVGLYFFLVTACVAHKSFKLNWQLAGFIAVVNFFAFQTSWDILFWLQDIPYPWSY